MSAGNIGITVTAWVPPSDYCPPTWQQAVQDIINNSTFAVTQPNAQVFMSNTKPSQTQNGTFWIETVGAPPFTGISPGNSTPIAYWSYDTPLASWVWPNPFAPSTSFRALWYGSEASVWSFDGGDGTNPNVNEPYTNPPVANPSYVAPTATTGAMWMVDHTFDAKFVLTPGILPGPPSGTGYIPTPSLTDWGNTGGEQFHLLTNLETAPHIHTYTPVGAGGTSPPGTQWQAGLASTTGTGGVQNQEIVVGTGPGGGFALMDAAGKTSGPSGPMIGDPLAGYTMSVAANPYATAQYHNNMPPWITCFVIMRTSRTYYKH